jgi:hypothetical protein
MAICDSRKSLNEQPAIRVVQEDPLLVVAAGDDVVKARAVVARLVGHPIHGTTSNVIRPPSSPEFTVSAHSGRTLVTVAAARGVEPSQERRRMSG